MLWVRDSQLRRLHGFRWRMFRNANPGLTGWLNTAKAILMWQIRLLGLGWTKWKTYSREVEEVHSVSRWKQLIRMFRAGAANCIIPHDFYHFDLYKPENFRRLHEYLTERDTSEMQYYLSKRYDSDFIANKTLQSGLYASSALPGIPTLAEFRDGKVVGCDNFEQLAREPALFVKPRDGGCGIGHELWRRQPDGRFASGSEKALPITALIERLQTLSLESPQIIQPYITNHADLKDLSNGAFISLRIVTGVNEVGEVEALYASLKIPTGSAINDNVSSGALISHVDLESGIVGPARNVWFVNTDQNRHPDTGAIITGRKIPGWPSSAGLACEGHRAVINRQNQTGERPNLFLGWDIGIAADGPIIIETNMFFGDAFQCAGSGPVGTSRFGDLLYHHLNRLEPEYGPI